MTKILFVCVFDFFTFSELIDCRRNGVIAERDLQLCLHVVFALAVRTVVLQGVTVHFDAEHLCLGFHVDGNCNRSVRHLKKKTYHII